MKRIKKAMIVILALGLFSACTNQTDKMESEKNETASKVKKPSIENKKMDTIQIEVAAVGESMNELAFEPQSLSVPANSLIQLSFANKSSAAGMLHNFVLVELGAGQEIATAGIKAGPDNNFLPNDKRIVFSTQVLDLGEQVIVEFKSPKKGSYHYICTYPGHFPKMIGRFNVI